MTRDNRSQGSTTYHLLPESPLLSKKFFYQSQNKVQLIKLIYDELPGRIKEFQSEGCGNTFLLSGPNPLPIQIHQSIQIDRVDLKITHEEADIMLINQAIYLLSTENKMCVHVYREDTDVFVLLTHFYHLNNIRGALIMKSFSSDVDICSTVLEHQSCIPHLLSLHGLTHCDTVPALHRIGKKKALNAGCAPPTLGFGDPDFKQTTKFIAKCYGVSSELTNMSQVRYAVWRKKKF